MGWTRRGRLGAWVFIPEPEHKCKKPSFWFRFPPNGSIWECAECSTQWKVVQRGAYVGWEKVEI